MHSSPEDAEDRVDQRYRAIFAKAAVGIARVGLDGTFLEVNDKVCEITGYTRDELVGLAFQAITHADDLDADLALVQQLLAGAISDYALEKRYIRKDGSELWVNLSAALVRAADGAPDFFIATVEDIGARKRAERGLAESEERLRLMLDQLFAFVGLLSPDGVVLHANHAPLAAAGLTLEDVVGHRFEDAPWWSYDVAVQDQLRAAMRSAAEGRIVRYDVPVQMANGLMHIDFQVAPMRSADGELVGLIASAIDIDERKAAERHRELLIGELNHRVKNTLTIIQSIAVQTFRGLADVADRVRDFEQRLLALSGAHNLLTRGNWEAASLDQLIEEAILGPGARREQFDVAGPAVPLPPKTAVTLALAIHELCTNAIKYGALSRDAGKVTIRWNVDADDLARLTLTWEESGGPPVTPPAQKGFGSRMIERALALELNGEVLMQYRPEGLFCRLRGRLPAIGEIAA